MNIKLLACIITLCTITNCFSQKSKLNAANKDYDKMAYLKASEIYLDVAEKGFKSEELFKKLGDSFYFNANYTEAAKWYTQLFNFTKIEDPLYILRFSQSLRVSGDTEKADKLYADYAEITNVKSEFDINSDNMYEIYPLDINTVGLDFGGFVNNDTLYFSSNGRNEASKEKSDWGGFPFLNLYQVKVEDGRPIGAVNKLSGKLKSRYHDVSACVTKDGKTMYFTRTNASRAKKENGYKTEYLKIYSVKFVDGEWTDIEDLSINSNKFSTAHPALNQAEDKLYFVSDRPGSIGQTDIFYASIEKNGTLGEVINCGKRINTIGRESFPFVNQGKLYFASDGHLGFGGYDVFYAALNDNSTAVINIGKPINSVNDDFAYYFNNETKYGFISSNREGGQGNDDIYAFKEIQIRIHDKVTDEDTGLAVKDGTVTLLDKNNKTIAVCKTDTEGNYEFTTYIIPNTVRVEKDGYNSDEKIIPASCKDCEINFKLKRDIFELKDGSDLAKMLTIKDIYFDFDKWSIREDAKVELEKVIVALQKYPNITIDIRSHTDSRGKDDYNMSLSDKRANSTMQYLINSGISANRLMAKGYGESQLINNCKNETKCSEEEHQLNRRSEFIISVK